MRPLVYLDTGIYDSLIDLPWTRLGAMPAISEATFDDWKNHKDPIYKVRKGDAQKAALLVETSDLVALTSTSIEEHWRAYTFPNFEMEAALLSFFNGGGENETIFSLILELAQVSDFDEEDTSILTEHLTKLQLNSGDLHTNSEILPLIQKNARNNESIDHTKLVEEIRLQVGNSPNFHTVQYVYQALGLIGIGTSKQIRSPNTERSRKIATHDLIDARHVAFALFSSSVFITTDKATSQKAKIIRDIWKPNMLVALAEKTPPCGGVQ